MEALSQRRNLRNIVYGGTLFLLNPIQLPQDTPYQQRTYIPADIC